MVIYLILAGVLYASLGWQAVLSRLNAARSMPLTLPSSSSITQAMRRVGIAPLRRLFTLLAGPAVTASQRNTSADVDGEFFADRRVVAIDGTQIPVADTTANRAEYPKPTAGPNGPAGYPMVRLLAVVTCGIRSVLDAVFGTDTRSELHYAETLTDPDRCAGIRTALGTGMLLLADRNFATRRLMARIADTGADFLIRIKQSPTALTLPVDSERADGSYLSHAGATTVRVIDAEVTTDTGSTGPGKHTGSYRLVTSILDPDEASAEELVEVYHRRWVIETSFKESKSGLLDNQVLRGKHPIAVAQQLWALLTVYQALRTVMADTVIHTSSTTTDRLSFRVAVTAARDHLVLSPTARPRCSYDSLLGFVGMIGLRLLEQVMPDKRVRVRPRVVKRAISKYRAKGRDVDRTSYPATVSVNITTRRTQKPLTTKRDP